MYARYEATWQCLLMRFATRRRYTILIHLCIYVCVCVCICDVKRGEYDQVITHASEVLKTDARSVKALMRRAKAFLAMNNTEAAEQDVALLARLEPEDAQVKVLLRKLKQTKVNIHNSIPSKSNAIPSPTLLPAARVCVFPLSLCSSFRPLSNRRHVYDIEHVTPVLSHVHCVLSLYLQRVEREAERAVFGGIFEREHDDATRGPSKDESSGTNTNSWLTTLSSWFAWS